MSTWVLKRVLLKKTCIASVGNIQNKKSDESENCLFFPMTDSFELIRLY